MSSKFVELFVGHLLYTWSFTKPREFISEVVGHAILKSVRMSKWDLVQLVQLTTVVYFSEMQLYFGVDFCWVNMCIMSYFLTS